MVSGSMTVYKTVVIRIQRTGEKERFRRTLGGALSTCCIVSLYSLSEVGIPIQRGKYNRGQDIDVTTWLTLSFFVRLLRDPRTHHPRTRPWAAIHHCPASRQRSARRARWCCLRTVCLSGLRVAHPRVSVPIRHPTAYPAPASPDHECWEPEHQAWEGHQEENAQGIDP
jgi:hypothetical protein